MVKVLTPEKKAQFKKAVLDSIDEAQKPIAVSPKKATVSVVRRSNIATKTIKPVNNVGSINNASPIRSRVRSARTLSSVARSSASVDSPLIGKSKKSSLTSASLESAHSGWDDKFFNSKPSSSPRAVKKSSGSRGMKIVLWIIAVVVILFIAFAGFDVYAIYKLGWRDSISTKVASILPLPAASVGNKTILVRDYFNDLNILEYALDNNREAIAAGVISSNNKGTVLNRLIGIEITKEQLAKYGKSVSDNDLNTNLDNLIAQFASRDEANQSVKKLYGISLDQFKAKVLRPLMERELLQGLVASDDTLNITKESKAKSEDILKMALASGANFSALAKQYTEDEAGINTGGDLGYINRGELPAEIEKALFALPNNTVYNQLVKNGLGYHVFYVENKITDKTTKKETIKLKQIFIKINVDQYIQDLTNSAKVKKFINVN